MISHTENIQTIAKGPLIKSNENVFSVTEEAETLHSNLTLKLCSYASSG